MENELLTWNSNQNKLLAEKVQIETKGYRLLSGEKHYLIKSDRTDSVFKYRSVVLVRKGRLGLSCFGAWFFKHCDFVCFALILCPSLSEKRLLFF